MLGCAAQHHGLTAWPNVGLGTGAHLVINRFIGIHHPRFNLSLGGALLTHPVLITILIPCLLYFLGRLMSAHQEHHLWSACALCFHMAAWQG